jgi:iron complex transport system substrate-binding protein
MKHKSTFSGKSRDIQLHFSEAKCQSLHPCGKPQGIRRRRIISFICFIFLLIFAGRGEAKTYSRVISLGPAITESIYLLGGQDKLIADTVYCAVPPEAKFKEKIGTLLDINIEKAVSLAPDLILATSLTPPAALAAFKKFNIETVIFPEPKDFSRLCGQLIELGRMIGRLSQAEAITAKAAEEVRRLKRTATNGKSKKVFVQIGANPLFTVTGGSFINDLIISAGGANIAEGASAGMYSREKVIEQNPDVIIISNMGFVAEEEKKEWQKYKTIGAVKNSRIYFIDEYKLGTVTPVSFVETLSDFIKFLE